MRKKLSSLDRNLLAAGGIVLAIVLFLSLNLLSNALFKTVRLDLTEDALFTVSDGTKQVLAAIDEPITLRLYQSKQLGDLGPLYKNHVSRVNELLQDYARLSGGMVRIESYDPQPFSPEEDLAVADGLNGLVIDTSGTQIFFGLTGSNSTDDRETIAYLAPERANFLEYDLTRLVYDLANPVKPVVGVLGDLPLAGDQFSNFQPWLVYESIEQFFDVRPLQGSLTRIDDDVKILLLAQPSSLDEKTLYAVDQFVMRGGRVLAYVDPLAEILAARSRGGPPPASAPQTLQPLLKAWGVEIPGDTVVGDFDNSVQVRAQHQGRAVVTNYLPWIGVTAPYLAADDVVTGNLKQINLRTAGSIRLREGASTTLQPLVLSSTEASEIETAKLRFAPDPVALLTEFKPSGDTYTLAARVFGPIKSAFPEGPPASVEDEKIRAEHREEAAEPLNLVLVADADFLADQSWVQASSLLGQRFNIPTANNGDFTVNALDNLSGSQGLFSLRGRGLNIRPFEVLEAMSLQAEEKFRAQEQALLRKIDQTREKIRQLQQDEQEGGIILTATQQETIDKFRAEMITQRRELRDVQHALRQDVERLEARLSALNIWAVPLALGVLAIVLAALRRRRAARFQADAEP